jgi:hypothetical protein
MELSRPAAPQSRSGPEERTRDIPPQWRADRGPVGRPADEPNAAPGTSAAGNGAMRLTGGGNDSTNPTPATVHE